MKNIIWQYMYAMQWNNFQIINKTNKNQHTIEREQLVWKDETRQRQSTQIPLEI